MEQRVFLERARSGRKEEQFGQAALLDERQARIRKDVRLARRHALHASSRALRGIRRRAACLGGGFVEADSAEEAELEVTRDAAADKEFEPTALCAEENGLQREAEALRQPGEVRGQVGRGGRGACLGGLGSAPGV